VVSEEGGEVVNKLVVGLIALNGKSAGITDEFSADDTEIAVSFTVAIRLPGKTFQSRIRLAKILQRRFSNNVDSQVHPAHQATYYTAEDPWTFCPDIGRPNIRAKLPEKAINIKIAGQIDLLINGSSGTRPRDQ